MADESSPPILASDAEREHACGLLRDATVDGRLTLDDFSQRVERALAARTRDQLDEMVRDLPAVSRIERTGRPPVRWSISVMGEVARRGYWRMDDDCWAVSVMGSCKLDLRGAVISAPVTTINVFVLMGEVKVTVPEGIEVELAGMSIMGSKALDLSGPPPPPGAPVVRVNAVVVMGGLKVRDRPGLGERLKQAVEGSLGRALGLDVPPQNGTTQP